MAGPMAAPILLEGQRVGQGVQSRASNQPSALVAICAPGYPFTPSLDALEGAQPEISGIAKTG